MGGLPPMPLDRPDWRATRDRENRQRIADQHGPSLKIGMSRLLAGAEKGDISKRCRNGLRLAHIDV
jgi:hypothetical protein